MKKTKCACIIGDKKNNKSNAIRWKKNDMAEINSL